MADAESPPVSELLAQCQAGDEEAFRKLLAAAYPELRRLAHYHLRGERPNHTLQSTALVHEAYVRLLKTEPTEFHSRAHFFGACSQLMRQILVDYARARCAVKRRYLLTVDPNTTNADIREMDILALDDALSRLAKLDSRQSKIVELRFFGGLSIEETAAVLQLSTATIKREWTSARLFLHKMVRARGSQTAPRALRSPSRHDS